MIKINKTENGNWKKWRQLIAEAEVFQGTRKQFCQLHQISESSLYYYQRELKLEAMIKAQPEQKTANGFVKALVEQKCLDVHQTSKTTIPDPKWAAEVMLHLWRMSS